MTLVAFGWLLSQVSNRRSDRRAIRMARAAGLTVYYDESHRLIWDIHRQLIRVAVIMREPLSDSRQNDLLTQIKTTQESIKALV